MAALPPLAEVWLAERDQLLRGLNHALSNRIGTVAAVAGALLPGEPPAEALTTALADEALRLEALLDLLRLLPADRLAAPEPVTLRDLVGPLLALHAHHAEVGDVPCVVEHDPAAPPAWVSLAATEHALLVLLTAAKRRAGTSGVVRLRTGGDARRATVTVWVDGGVEGAVDDSSALVAVARWLLGASGHVEAHGTGFAVGLPVLGDARNA